MNNTSLASPNPFKTGGGGGNYNGTSPTTITVGGLTAGSNIAGASFQSIFQSMLAPYVNPSFTSAAVSGSGNVEDGTTLSGNRTFTWAINSGSGSVTTVDILDISASTVLLAGTPNDGSQVVAITNRTLSVGQTQQWRIRGNNTSPSGTFLSAVLSNTARYYEFFGPVAATPTTSAQVRVLDQSFYTGPGTVILNTGTVRTIFVIAMAPGTSFSSIIDLDALNANITADYINIGTVSVLNAEGSGSPVTYTLFQLTTGAPYSSNHKHQITFN